jgi:hypothetical protein
MSHPLKQSQDIAALIRVDPIAAGLIKEHIPPAELRETLGIKQTMEEFFEDVPNEQLWQEVEARLKATCYRLDDDLKIAMHAVNKALL